MQTGAAHSWTCMDLYVFATPYRIMWDYYFSAREHTLEIKSWEEQAEMEYVCLVLGPSYLCCVVKFQNNHILTSMWSGYAAWDIRISYAIRDAWNFVISD